MFPTIKPITDKGGLVIVVVYKTKKYKRKVLSCVHRFRRLACTGGGCVFCFQ